MSVSVIFMNKIVMMNLVHKKISISTLDQLGLQKLVSVEDQRCHKLLLVNNNIDLRHANMCVPNGN